MNISEEDLFIFYRKCIINKFQNEPFNKSEVYEFIKSKRERAQPTWSQLFKQLQQRFRQYKSHMLYLTLWQYQYEFQATEEPDPELECAGVFSPIDESTFK